MSEYGTQLREGGGPEWDFEQDRNPESGSLDAGLLTQPAVSSERIAQLVDTLGLALRVGADQAGDGPDADVITYADRWLRDTSGMTYGAVLNVLELADAQDGIDWTHSLIGPQTPQFDVRHIGGWINPFSGVMDYGTAVWDVTGAPWLRLVQGKPTETFGHDLSRAWQHATQADTRLYGYGGNPYGNKAANVLGVHSPSDALWAALDVVDIASLRWGGAIIAPVRQMLREAAERGGRREIADAIALQSRSIRSPDRFGPEHDIPLADTLDQLRPDRFGPEHDIPLADTLDQLRPDRFGPEHDIPLVEMLARGRAEARTWFDNLSDKDQAAAIVEWEKSSKPHYTDPDHVFDPADDYDVRNAYTAARRARETEMRTMWDNISTGEREVIEADYRAAMPTFPEGIDPDPADMMRWYEQQGPPGDVARAEMQAAREAATTLDPSVRATVPDVSTRLSDFPRVGPDKNITQHEAALKEFERIHYYLYGRVNTVPYGPEDRTELIKHVAFLREFINDPRNVNDPAIHSIRDILKWGEVQLSVDRPTRLDWGPGDPEWDAAKAQFDIFDNELSRQSIDIGESAAERALDRQQSEELLQGLHEQREAIAHGEGNQSKEAMRNLEAWIEEVEDFQAGGYGSDRIQAALEGGVVEPDEAHLRRLWFDQQDDEVKRNLIEQYRHSIDEGWRPFDVDDVTRKEIDEAIELAHRQGDEFIAGEAAGLDDEFGPQMDPSGSGHSTWDEDMGGPGTQAEQKAQREWEAAQQGPPGTPTKDPERLASVIRNDDDLDLFEYWKAVADESGYTDSIIDSEAWKDDLWNDDLVDSAENLYAYLREKTSPTQQYFQPPEMHQIFQNIRDFASKRLDDLERQQGLPGTPSGFPAHITDLDSLKNWSDAEMVARPVVARPEEAEWRALHLGDWPSAEKVSIQELAAVQRWSGSYQGLSYNERPIWFARDTPEEWAQRQKNAGSGGMRDHDLWQATGPVGDTGEAALYREEEAADRARGLFPKQPHVVEHLRRYGYSDEDIARLLDGPEGGVAPSGPPTGGPPGTPERPYGIDDYYEKSDAEIMQEMFDADAIGVDTDGRFIYDVEEMERLYGPAWMVDDLGEMFRREIPDFTPPGQPPMGYRDILAMDKDELLARHLGDGDNATTEWYVATLEAELVDLQGTLDAGLVKGRAKIEHRINEIYAEFETGGFWKNVHGTLRGGRPLDPGGRSGGYGERLDFTTDEIDEIVRNNGPTDEEIRAFYENREGPPSGPVSGGAVTVDPHDELLVWSHPLPLVKIISGGQTGADIAGLSAGKELGLEVGGVAPRGYRTDVGSNYDLRDLYGVTEHTSASYSPRTLENIRNSDGTIIFDFTRYSRGSDETRDMALRQNKPLLDIRSADDIDPVAIRAWIINENIRVLNVAGNRESSTRGINQIVHDALTEMAGPPPSSLGFDVGPPRARPVVGESPAEVNLSLMTLTERKQFLEESLKDLDTLPDQYFMSREEGGFGTRQGIAKQRKDLQDAIKEIDVRLAAEQELKESLVQGTASGTIVHFERRQNTILSNFADTPFRFRGAEFRTAEGAYQAYKSGNKRDGYEMLTGPEAKERGYGQWVNRRTSLNLMREVLAEKYRQVPEFRDALNAAEGRITHPVSDVFWRDNFPMLLDELRTPTAKSGKPVVEYIAHMDVATLRANPEKFYLFGDNLQERGKRGQAIIRDEPNAIGIPTKKRPSMNDDAFFTDTELASNQRAIDRALNKIPSGATVVIPEKGLGTGLARLEEKAPKTFEYLETRLDELRTSTAGSSAAAPPAAQTKEGFEREALETFENTNPPVIPPHIQAEDIRAVRKDLRGYVNPQSTPELAADYYSRLVEVIDYRSKFGPLPGHTTEAESVHEMLTGMAHVMTAPQRPKPYPPWPRTQAGNDMLLLTRDIDAAVDSQLTRLDSMEGGRIDIDAKEAQYREAAEEAYPQEIEPEGFLDEYIDESGPEMDWEERDALFREETERLLENPPDGD